MASKEKRLRIFAGPNGSGKSSLFHDFSNKADFKVGYFLNADNVEKELREKGFINLSELNLEVDKKSFQDFNKSSSLKRKAKKEGYKIDIKFKDNILVNLPKETNSYEAAFVTAFIRQEFIKTGISYSFETVMSHPSKLDEMVSAKNAGYKTYLYYICTESPIINKDRIDNRVEMGGHNVDEDKIRSRYFASLNLLYNAIKLVRRAYIFDNSGREYKLIAEFFEGEVKYHNKTFPKWFLRDVIEKMDV
ncbi:hypothetical protein [Sporocytophaga myxococcoides]|uniref:hypothetical protein n=1 Tax=Sporocytophaga myxococcoides TaxID=153721 RepID=UPI000427556D|nr:hypothetical protein [Sporocytophaga myxococcoides]